MKVALALGFCVVAAMGNGEGKGFGPDATEVLSKQVRSVSTSNTETAVFAGGCFWGVELSFQRVPGVVETSVGYVNGNDDSVSYEEVCRGTTGHTEAVKVVFDPEAVSYEELLTVLWDRIDPTTKNRQGNDVGTQYRSGIYFTTRQQQAIATSSKMKEQEKYLLPIVTEIAPLEQWVEAEAYHQQYLGKGGQSTRIGDTSPIMCYGL